VRNGEIAMKITALLVAAAVVATFAPATYADTIDPAQAIAQKFSDAGEARPSPPQRSFASPGADYEADMLARARSEEVERQQQRDAGAVAAKPAAIIAPAASVPVPPANPPQPPAAKLAGLPTKPVAESPPRPVAHAEPAVPSPSTATILLVLDTDHSSLGFKPDPIVCMDNKCWLSGGISSPARQMPRNQAVALDGTGDKTADSCSGKSGCIYRNVTVDPAARIDVIEVGEDGGASAGAYTVAADKSCRKQGDALVCDNGLATQNFRIWVVPEAIAEAAGASSLENAVAEGLIEADVMSANDK
jgi:hypothetical protein